MSRLASVDVLVVSWNGREHLEICLAALAKQDDPGCRWSVRVLDNGSTDGTVDWLRSRHPEVIVDASPRNLGFAAAVNRLVDGSDADAVVLLNNDTRPESDWLAALVDGLASAPDDVAAVSGVIVDWDGECLDFGRGAMTFDAHAFQAGFGRPLTGDLVPAAGEELLFACGGNMIAWRDRFLAAGGFDDDYFAYFEDVDFGWRTWSGGERVVAAPEAIVRHRSSGTSDRLGNERRGLLFERNAYVTAAKNYDEELWTRMEAAILLTLLHRTQTMLVHNNPGSEAFVHDPYGDGPPAPSVPHLGPLEKVRAYGPKESVVRLIRKLGRVLAGVGNPPIGPTVSDPRTVAQFQAVTYVLGHLDRTEKKRQSVQERRRRPDREIFERFPLYVVPTYPGDETLFATAAFRRRLPSGLPVVDATLDDLISRG